MPNDKSDAEVILAWCEAGIAIEDARELIMALRALREATKALGRIAGENIDAADDADIADKALTCMAAILRGEK